MIASVATAARYESAACDGGRFISPEERASAPLGLSPQRSFIFTCDFSAPTRYESVGCDEENFSSPEELRLVAHLAELKTKFNFQLASSDRSAMPGQK